MRKFNWNETDSPCLKHQIKKSTGHKAALDKFDLNFSL